VKIAAGGALIGAARVGLAAAESRSIGLEQDPDVTAPAAGVRSAVAVVVLMPGALIEPPHAPAAIPGRRAISSDSTAAVPTSEVNHLALLVLTS